MANSSGKECSDIVGKIDNGKIHLGYGIYLCTEKYYAILNKANSSRIAKKSSNKACLFVKEIAIAIFGSKTLLEKTVTGCESNRTKNKKSKQVKPDNTDTTGNKLDPTKVLAIKDKWLACACQVRKPRLHPRGIYSKIFLSERTSVHSKKQKCKLDPEVRTRDVIASHLRVWSQYIQCRICGSAAIPDPRPLRAVAAKKDKVTPPETSDETSLSTKEILPEHQEESDQFKKIALCDNDSVQSTSNRISTSLSNTTLSDSVQSTSNRKSMSLSNTSLSSSSLDYSSQE
ncbi:PREDICTED: uncharacterized protein LOC105462825 [Wasmannia auropunctata]|uniref:uncharacterized protein LOC105462825 n=1 Tax=Wasmannia auropunctata TaxID=64793 RepID=UPI0005EDBDA2|nr:PREDICTED: uncharacterized protein LOC105462825 [Wasmannia auropunctata]